MIDPLQEIIMNLQTENTIQTDVIEELTKRIEVLERK